MRLLRTTGGKAALDLKRRSAHGFNAMCQRAKELFKTFDKDNSGWLECTDLPNLLPGLILEGMKQGEKLASGKSGL